MLNLIRQINTSIFTQWNEHHRFYLAHEIASLVIREIAWNKEHRELRSPWRGLKLIFQLRLLERTFIY